MTIRKNAQFSNKCEIRDRDLNWSDIEFCVSDVMLKEELKELEQAIKDRNCVEILDGACDVAVIALNTCYKLFRLFNLNHDESLYRTEKAFEIVTDSNLSKIKLDGTVNVVDNKVKKPDTFKAPDFTKLLEDILK